MKVLPPTNSQSSYSIVDTVRRCGFQVKRQSGNFVLNCPFHTEKTPSLVLFPDTNTWRCFGKCIREKNGGDSVTFVRQLFNYSYSQAVLWLEGNQVNSFEIKIEPKPKPKMVPPENIHYWHSLMDLDHRREYFHSRGFGDDFINRELWGWDGHRYIIPVWESEPGNSLCLGVRRRRSEDDELSFKYIGLKGHNQSTVAFRYYCQYAETVIAFAGEFDAARSISDNIPAFSLVNGVNSFDTFPQNWPDLWFPNCKNLVVVFDQKEEVYAARFSSAWNRVKGMMTGKPFHWPPIFNIKDYCEFRDRNHAASHFKLLIFEQTGIKL